ncbi:MAG: threo-3-hydroxy-L-aspartate ammonia-lyase [Nesterenkonia sp.]
MSALESEPITYDDVAAAHERIRASVHRTPVLTSRSLDARAGASLLFKAENLQRVGAFKIRGAMNAVATLTDEQKSRGVVAYSSGNHAQAIALAAREHGVDATILMPEDAPAGKVAATRDFGAHVVRFDRYTEDREALAEEISLRRGATIIPPFDHPAIMAGQGTAAKELLEDAGPLDALLVPLGGGGLLSGSALAARALAPDITIYGVEPAAGNDGQLSFRSGEVVQIPTPDTIADGAQTRSLGHHTFPVIRELVDDIVTVTDEQLASATVLLAERLKTLVEPTGALAAAAALTGAVDVEGLRVGVILSGGNVDLDRLAALKGTV